jgi:hypothetical protein
MDTYPRPATLTHDSWGLPWSRPIPPERAPVDYRLPGGSTVSLAWDLCKGALFVPFTLKGGKVVSIERKDA